MSKLLKHNRPAKLISLIIFSLALCYGLLEVLPAQTDAKMSAANYLQGEKIDDIQNTYLRLFKKLLAEESVKQQHVLNSQSSDINQRNPFAQPRGHGGVVGRNADPGGTTLELKGILWDEISPMAIINDKVVHVGGTIASFTVTRIEPRKVTLSGTGNTVLSLIEKQGEIR